MKNYTRNYLNEYNARFRERFKSLFISEEQDKELSDSYVNANGKLILA